MTEKRQTQVTILAVILGLLTLSFLVVASSGVVFVMLVTPTPNRIVVTAKTTPVIIEMKTAINVGPGTPFPTLNPTQKAINATALARPITHLLIPTHPPPKPAYIKTMKRLGSMDGWGETLGVILVLMLISSLMLFTRLSKQD